MPLNPYLVQRQIKRRQTNGTQSSSHPEVHKVETNGGHSIQSYAIISISKPVRFAPFRFVSQVLFHIPLGLYVPPLT
jgi:hypothetical protein